MIDKAIPQGQDGHLDHCQEEWLRLMPDGWDGTDYVAENTKLRGVIDEITEVVEANDPALVWFIAKRMKRIRVEEDV